MFNRLKRRRSSFDKSPHVLKTLHHQQSVSSYNVTTINKKEGFLDKLSRNNKFQTRYFSLNGHYLLYYADIKYREKKPSGFIDLNNYLYSEDFHNNFYHLYIPIMEDQMYVRPLETLPSYEHQDKKYVEIITHLRNDLSSSDFKKFIQDYKRFLVDINCKKDILERDLIKMIKEEIEYKKYFQNKKISKKIYVRNKIINFILE